MNAEQFNALPLEARQYIEKQRACQSCGKSQDLDRHYRNYLAMKNNSLYTLRLGAVVFKDIDGTGKVLYPIHPKDSEAEIKVKLAQALTVHATRPDKFSTFSEEKILEILGAKSDDETEAEKKEVEKPLYGAAKKSAEAKAKKVERSEDDLN